MVIKKKPAAHREKCALPGCERTFRVAATGRKRRYCCDVHRAQASRLHRAHPSDDPPLSAATAEQLHRAAAARGWIVAANVRPDDPADPPPDPGAEIPHGRRAAALSSVNVNALTQGAHLNFGRSVSRTTIYIREDETEVRHQ